MALIVLHPDKERAEPEACRSPDRLFPGVFQDKAPELPGFPGGEGHCHPAPQGQALHAELRPDHGEAPGIADAGGRDSGGQQTQPPLLRIEKEVHAPTWLQGRGGGVIRGDRPPKWTGQAGFRNQEAVALPGQQAAAREPEVRTLPLLRPRGGRRPEGLRRGAKNAAAKGSCAHRNPFLQKTRISPHGAVLQKAPHHGIFSKQIVAGQQAHALVVRHPAAHSAGLFPQTSGGAVVQSLPEALFPPQPHSFQPPQILQGRLGTQGQRQEAAVRGNHIFLVHSGAQGQPGAAVGFVAVVHGGVQSAVSALRGSPGAVSRPLPLDIEAEAGRLEEETVPVQGQEQIRHQVLKHGAGPAHHPLVAAPGHLGAAQSPPVLRRDIAPGHRQIGGEPGLRAHEVVPGGGKPLLLQVVTDGKEPLPGVIEGAKVHGVRQCPGPLRQRGKAVFPQTAFQGDEAGAEVSTVNGGDILRRQGRKAAGVVPVVEVPVPAGQGFHAVQAVTDQRPRFPGAEKAQVRGGQDGEESQPDIGGTGPVGQSHRRLNLPVVRREPVVLRPQAFGEKTPGVPGAAEEIVPVRFPRF